MPPSKFKPRPHKQKAKAEAAALQASLQGTSRETFDANTTEHIPLSRNAREERKAKLQADLAAHDEANSKISSKKRKRLDKYIETKLRKDENADLIKKLETSRIDTSLLKSAKKLGRSTENRREAASRALKEQRAGIRQGLEDDLLYQRWPSTSPEGSSDSEEGSDDYTERLSKLVGPTAADLQAPIGTGLRQPLRLDENGNPIIKVRQRKKQKQYPTSQTHPVEEDEWEGLSSCTGSPSHSPSEAESETEASSADSDEDLSLTESEDDLSDEHNGFVSERDDHAKERASAFTAWANQQRNDAVGFVPTPNIRDQYNAAMPKPETQSHINKVDLKPGVTGLQPANTSNVFHVLVTRSKEIQKARTNLPIVAEEQKIMEAIQQNATTIIWGATGSGKTTQVPQFLFEAGYGQPQGPNPGLIGVTQPRRVAAVSVAKRVGDELGKFRTQVAHQVRFDSSVGPTTAIKFMTDGVLLREISQDFTLSKYSAIVIDEAHERSVNTDILIGMLSRIVETRTLLASKNDAYRPLKLIIMSATLRINDFTENKSLFRYGVPPLVQAEGRQFPVTVHFARITKRDYVNECVSKLSRGHKKLPPGGILVFLTGQDEISRIHQQLKDSFPTTHAVVSTTSTMRVSARTSVVEDGDFDSYNVASGSNLDFDEIADAVYEDHFTSGDVEHDDFDIEGEEPVPFQKMHILPLYSQLPTEEQMRVFEPVPEGARMIVLATNVAETSLTIPGIRYVFDCGRAKEKHLDRLSGVQTFQVGWISKASASQRAGRAGRTGPGHCYRLYSSAVYERDFVEFSEPEILRTPIESIVLQLKSMGIPKILNFPFPTRPDPQSLVKAERLLGYLGALMDGKVTAVGRELAIYPLSPRLAKILVLSQQYGCAEYAIALVSVLAVQELFVPEVSFHKDVGEDSETLTKAHDHNDTKTEQRRKDYSSFHRNLTRLDKSSDAIKFLVTLLDFLEDLSWGMPSEHYRTFTRVKSLHEALKLQAQLHSIAASDKPGIVAAQARQKLPEPSKKQIQALRQLVAAGFIDQIAIRADLSPTPPDMPRTPRRAIEVPYLTLFPLHDEKVEVMLRSNDPEVRDSARQAQLVYIHSSSVLAHSSIDKLPQYLVYSHLSKSHSLDEAVGRTGKRTKTRMHPLAPLSAQQVVAIAHNTSLIEQSKPIGKIEMLERDSLDGCEKRTCWTMPYLRGDSGLMQGNEGWPLPPARKVTQKRLPGKGWTDIGPVSS